MDMVAGINQRLKAGNSEGNLLIKAVGVVDDHRVVVGAGIGVVETRFHTCSIIKNNLTHGKNAITVWIDQPSSRQCITHQSKQQTHWR